MWVWQPSVVVKNLCCIQRACCMMSPSLRGDHQIDLSWAGRPSSLTLGDTSTVWTDVTVTGGHMVDTCTVTDGPMDSRERCNWLSLVDRDSSNYASALYAFKSFTWSSFEALMREWSLTFKTSRNLLHLSSSILTLTATCGVFYPVHYLFKSRLTTFDS